MKVPFLNFQSRYEQLVPSLIQAAEETIRSGRYIGGNAVTQLEHQIADLFDTSYAVGVANGTDALVLALQAVGVQAEDEVIIPAVSFFATAGAVKRIGATPVVVDVLPERPLIDPVAVLRSIGPKTRAVIPVHLFGDRAKLPELPIPIIDDSAQAVGCQPPAFHGQIAAMSFYPSKILGALGDAGMVVCQDQGLAQKIRQLANHGYDGVYHQLIDGHAGTNSRLDTIQANFLLQMLPELPAIISQRNKIVARYDAAFGQLAIPRALGTVPSLYIIRHQHRDQIRDLLAQKGVETRIYYPYSLVQQPALARSCPTPHADLFCRQSLALPCYEGMSDAQIDYVIQGMHQVLTINHSKDAGKELGS